MNQYKLVASKVLYSRNLMRSGVATHDYLMHRMQQDYKAAKAVKDANDC